MNKTKEKTVTGVIEVPGKDVVITDPCYLVGATAWQEFCEELGGEMQRPNIRELSGIRMLVADTIWGDWACRLHRLADGEIAEAIGTFTADSGMICAAILDGSRISPDLHKMCYSVIPNFTGRVMIVHKNGECHVEGIGESDGRRIEFASRQYC